MKTRFLPFLLFILFSISGFSQSGSIKGRVFNAKNNEPLPFTNIIISGTTIGSTSDLDGNFTFTALKPGYVKLIATAVGFENVTTEEILVTNSKQSNLDIPMIEKIFQIETVEVKASLFKRVEESPVSLKSLGISQIEKSPGANRDISKVIQVLPGVASSVSFRNDIIVRGGGPSENRFLLDGIEIPNLNHFATQGASGGPVGIINTDFLREVDFYSGAFPANRGNALSSVLDMKLIDGNDERIVYKATLGASEAALSLNGPLSEKTKVLVSIRRSYLQFLFDAIGLPFLPTFNDYQIKVKTRFDVKNELTFLSLGALDKLKLNMGIKNPTEEQQYILGNLPINNQWNYAIGAVYKNYRKNSYSTFVLSRNMLFNRAYKYENNIEEDDKLNIDYSSYEIENKFRYEEVTRIAGYKFTYGAGAEFAKYKNNTIQKVFIPTEFDTIRNLKYESDLNLVKWNIFGQISKSFIQERLMLSLGVRTDANNFSSQMSNPLKQLSPRFSASYMITEKLMATFNIGQYYQLPAYTTLGYRDGDGTLTNKTNGLRFIQSNHFVAGVDYRRNASSKFTLEGFAKLYNYYPFSIRDSVSLASKGADFGVLGDEPVVSTNKGRSYGTELYYRDKLNKIFEYTLSYTFVRSEFEDKNEEYVPSAWDNRHILNLTGMVTLKRNWEVGFKWRFVGGSPYTPYDLEKSSLVEAWNVRGQGYLDFDKFNMNRLSDFQQLDIRIDKEYFFKNLTLNLYLDVQNVYNFKSKQPDVLVQEKDDQGNPIVIPGAQPTYLLKKLANESGTVLPTIGIIVEI